MDTDQEVVMIGNEPELPLREMMEVLQTVCRDSDVIQPSIYSGLAGMIFPFRLQPDLRPPPGYEPPKRSSVPLRKYPSSFDFRNKKRLSAKKAKHKAGFAGM
jgi:hypothetical protein